MDGLLMLGWDEIPETEDEAFEQGLKTGKWWNRRRVVRLQARRPTVEPQAGRTDKPLERQPVRRLPEVKHGKPLH